MRAAPILLIAFLASASPNPAAAQDAAGFGMLVPGDRVRVEVAADSTLSGDFDIDAEGWVLLPVAGMVRAAGRPFAQLAVEVRDAFAREYLDLPVRVIPLVRVSVLGEVTDPGVYWIDPTMMLADVLAGSGGMTANARVDDVRLHRGTDVLVLAGSAFEPIPMRSGDRVFVGRRGFLDRNGGILIGAGASVLAAILTSIILR